MDIAVIVCQVFLMLGMGISLRVTKFWSHIFMARVFQHCTCMPVFICNKRVFFGRHPYVHVAAWGGSTPGLSAQEKGEGKGIEKEIDVQPIGNSKN